MDTKIYVAGHNGMVGSAILRALNKKNYNKIITTPKSELDLTNQQMVHQFLNHHKPDYIYIAAAKVGGIHANNTYRAEFIYQNLMINANIIHAAWQVGTQKILFLGSSCIYPKESLQPIKEEYLLSGYLEPTNEPYAIAKIASLKMCESYNRQYGTQYLCVMPTNLYGPKDNYNLETSHVIPALIRKFHEAKIMNSAFVEIWGTGTPYREFLHVDDLAKACVLLMEKENKYPLYNVGSGEDLSIKELAFLIAETVGFNGDIIFNTSKPDGTPKKLLDISRISELGWKPEISLYKGLKSTYKEFQNEIHESIKELV